MNLFSIRDVLSYPEKNPNTWFYLPQKSEEWTLDTMGAFSEDSYNFPPDSKDYLPEQVEKEGWIETLDTESIEDVIEYANAQLENPTIDQLFDSFIYYYENDAFLDF